MEFVVTVYNFLTILKPDSCTSGQWILWCVNYISIKKKFLSLPASRARSPNPLLAAVPSLCILAPGFAFQAWIWRVPSPLSGQRCPQASLQAPEGAR